MRAFAFLFLSGCALVSGLSEVKVSDAIDAGADGAIEAAGCPQSCGAIPEGWQAVNLTASPTESCGSLVANDWFTGLAPKAMVCPCSCTTNPPNCTAGDLTPHIGDQCQLNTFTFSAGKCNALSTTLPSAINVATLPPSGGSCGAPSTAPVLDAAKVGVRTCSMPQGCSGAPCPSTGQRACIVHPGAAMACPVDYPMTTSVGTDVTATCACGPSCTFVSSCTNAKLHAYSDAQCAMEITAVAADGKCNSTGMSGKATGSFQYTATPVASCNASPGTPTPSLIGSSTMCCKP